MRCGARMEVHEVRSGAVVAAVVCTSRNARDCNMYVQWDIQYIQGLQRGVTAGEQPAPGSGGAGSRSGAGLVLQLHAACIYTPELPAKGGRDGARATGERRAGGRRTGQLAGV